MRHSGSTIFQESCTSVWGRGVNMRSDSRSREFLGRRRRAFVLALQVFFLMPLHASAGRQSSGDVTPHHQPQRQHKRPSIDDRVKSLAELLDLNERQQTELKRVLWSRHDQVIKILRTQSLSPVDRVNQFRAINDNTVERITALLNEEQKEKYNPPRQQEAPGISPKASLEDWLKVTRQK